MNLEDLGVDVLWFITYTVMDICYYYFYNIYSVFTSNISLLLKKLRYFKIKVIKQIIIELAYTKTVKHFTTTKFTDLQS